MREPSVEQGRVVGMEFAVVSIEKVIGFSATTISGNDVSLEVCTHFTCVGFVVSRGLGQRVWLARSNWCRGRGAIVFESGG